MNKRKLAHFLVCVGIVGFVGCANTEPEIVRRNNEEYLINGASYASAGENEENVFGSESKGIKDNPKTKPSSEMLGASGQYEKIEMTLEPEHERRLYALAAQFAQIV